MAMANADARRPCPFPLALLFIQVNECREGLITYCMMNLYYTI